MADYEGIVREIGKAAIDDAEKRSQVDMVVRTTYVMQKFKFGIWDDMYRNVHLSLIAKEAKRRTFFTDNYPIRIIERM